MAQINFRLPDDLKAKLTDEAAKQERSVTTLLTHAIRRYLKEVEAER